MKLEFSRQIFDKHSQISNFMKICPVAAVFFHSDGQKVWRDDADTRLLQLCECA